jgi:hypothetical protein
MITRDRGTRRIDMSAWNRLGHDPARARFEELVEADEAAT